MSAKTLRCLPLAAILCAGACQTSRADVPRVEGFGAFAVGYRGEVVALGAAVPFPDPVVAKPSADDARLVTVRTTLLELRVETAERFVPSLLTKFDPPAAPTVVHAAPAALPAAPAADAGKLQPRPPEPAQGFGQLPGAPAAKDPNSLATMRGVHVEPAALKRALGELLRSGHARLIGEPEVSCAEGTEAAVSCLDQTALVQRIDLVPSGNSEFAFDLAVGPVQHGTWLQLSPHRTQDGGLQLGIRMQLRELVQPVPVAATRFGRLHVPAVAIQDLRALEVVKVQDGLVLGTMSGKEPGLVVLAIVEVQASRTGKGTWTLP